MSADKWCARTDLALETQESLKKANTDMRGVNFSEKKLDNGIIVSVAVSYTHLTLPTICSV